MKGSVYSAAVLERFDHPRHGGRARGDPDDLVVARAGSLQAGALVELSLRLDGARAAEARFRAFGCPHTIAAASRLAQHIEGQPIEALEGFDVHAIGTELEVPAEKLGRLLIIADCLAACVAEWRHLRPDQLNEEERTR